MKAWQSLSLAGRPLLAFAAGATTLLAFAPWSLYPMVFIGAGLLLALWRSASAGQAFREGYAFGLGLLGFGVFWMHISIDQFGNVGTPLAILITLLFVAAMALYYGLAGWLSLRLAGGRVRHWQALLIFSSLLVLGEWGRGWILTGFPWLSLGYSQIDAPLGAWAPLLGVYGVSWMAYLTAALLLLLLTGHGWQQRSISLAGLALIWGGAGVSGGLSWTAPAGAPLQITIIQGNVAQALKWRRETRQPTLERYLGLTRRQWESDLIIWPETAVPALADEVETSLLAPLDREAQEQGSSLLLGVPVLERDTGRYYNAMLSLGGERGRYYKRHLVPFGEFMPMKILLQPLVEWLQIPMSDFSSGQAKRLWRGGDRGVAGGRLSGQRQQRCLVW
jgi:apolipoprotein N-acyltransferase